MKRFYTLVSSEAKPEGYAILLDGRPVKTKSGALLIAQNQQIADETVIEWANQKEVIDPETMPFTQIINTRIDQVAAKRPAMSATVLNYLDTDLVCYIADGPEELVTLQELKWKKWRDWIETEFGHALKTTNGLAALSQASELHDAVKSYVEQLSDDRFTLLQIVVPLSGSLILGLALLARQASSQEVFDACFVEEHYKDGLYMVDKYGRDPHIEKKQQATFKDFESCERFDKAL